MEQTNLQKLPAPLLAWYDEHRRVLPWREQVVVALRAGPAQGWVSFSAKPRWNWMPAPVHLSVRGDRSSLPAGTVMHDSSVMFSNEWESCEGVCKAPGGSCLRHQRNHRQREHPLAADAPARDNGSQLETGAFG